MTVRTEPVTRNALGVVENHKPNNRDEQSPTVTLSFYFTEGSIPVARVSAPGDRHLSLELVRSYLVVESNGRDGGYPSGPRFHRT